MNFSKVLTTTGMKEIVGDHVLSNELSRINDKQRMKPTLLPEPSSPSTAVDGSSTSKHIQSESVLGTMNKIAKGKLSLGAKILQVSGVEKVFRKVFSVREGEQLMKASQCRLSTTAGPVSGRLFITTDKLAFCSNKPIVKFTSPSGQVLRFHYKVVIPLTKIKRANQCNNVKRPSQKYLEVVTTDDFEFWFLGFLNYKRTLKCLQQAVTQKLN